MIAAILLLAQSTESPRLHEAVVADADRVTVAIAIPAPEEMSARERTAWRLIGATLMQGTETFSRPALIGFGSQAGVAPRVLVYPDWMVVQFTAPETGEDVAAELAASLVKEARLRPEDIVAAQSRIPSPQPGFAHAWTDPFEFAPATVEDVRTLYDYAFRPERMTAVVMGKMEAGNGLARLEQFMTPRADRAPRRRPTRLPDRLAKVEGKVSVYDWNLPLLRPQDPGFVTQLTALCALGVGKESSVFRVWREQLGLSYRQELVMWPTKEGYRPHLTMWRAEDADAAETQKQAIEALKADIDEWDESDVLRSSSMLSSSLDYGLLVSPFRMGNDWTMSDSLEDRAVFAAHLRMIGFDRDDLRYAYDVAGNTDIERMKETARQLLDDSIVVSLTAAE